MRPLSSCLTLGLLTVCCAVGPATAAPLLLSYSAIVTSNSGDATDGIFPPGTRVTVEVQVDSESLLTGASRPASGSADTAGVSDLSLAVESAGSGLLIAVPGATARVISFRGEGPSFEADGDPVSDDIWQWTAANLYVPLVPDLDSLLALTLDDVNSLIAAFGSMQLLTFTHSPFPGAFEFERARTTALYEFSIELAPVPEPSLLPVLGLVAAALRLRRRWF